MSKVLRIFDVSAFVHAGKVNEYAMIDCGIILSGTSVTNPKIPCGGASLIWNVIYQHGADDMLFCIDRNPTIKREMLPSYKSNRKYDKLVQLQKDVTEYILQDCNFTTLSKDGYEGDDFVNLAVNKYIDYYDHIYIYTGDSDLYFLVSDKVTIEPSSSKAKRVTPSNYTYTVKSGDYVPYNTIALRKILTGDTADNIPPLYSQFSSEYMNAKGDFSTYDKIRDLFRQYGDSVAIEHSYWFEPLTPIGVDLSINTPDLKRVKAWGVAFSNSNFTRHDKMRESVSLVDESVNEIVRKGWVV